jgi:hypothetical protein
MGHNARNDEIRDPHWTSTMRRAARGRHITKTKFIERLLAVIIKDGLIDAVLDDRE